MNFFVSLMNSFPGALAQGIIWGIMALGVYLMFRIMNISDLTVDGSIATGGAVCVMLIRHGIPATIAVLCGFCAGAVAGLITAILHTKWKIPAILAGILTQLALYSINLRILGQKSNQPISVDKYRLVVSQRFVRDLSFFRNPIPILILITVAIIFLIYWFLGTEKGYSIRATGGNAIMARAQGINTEANIIIAFMIANGLVALSGALLSQYQGSADVNMGRGAIVIGLAAVIIGETLFKNIFRNFSLMLLSVVIGSIIYYLVLQVTLQLGLNTNDLKLISALLVALFLAIPNMKKGVKNAGNKKSKKSV